MALSTLTSRQAKLVIVTSDVDGFGIYPLVSIGWVLEFLAAVFQVAGNLIFHFIEIRDALRWWWEDDAPRTYYRIMFWLGQPAFGGTT